MITVMVNGETYNSIRAAWRQLSPPGLSEFTVRWRLKQGWPTAAAFLMPAIPPENRGRGNRAPWGEYLLTII